MTSTITLLGDSILDNAPYTQPEPDTTAHLGRMLGDQWSVVRLAQDGAMMAHVSAQIDQMPDPADVTVLSIGGNDATAHIGLLNRRVNTSAAVLHELLTIADDFEEAYEAVLQAVIPRSNRTIVCTIYEVQLEPPPFARLARVPLAVLNDRIIRTATRLRADVLELRSVCTTPDDFVLQIEPSPTGARKIAEAISNAVLQEAGDRLGRVFVGY